MGSVTGVLILLLQLYILVVFIRVILSWLSPYPRNGVMRFFWQITEPVLAPIRRRLPAVSGIDLSPLVVWLAALILISLLQRIST
jgi:YggT family protein